jgi:predicted phage terminase large subunit-like protein
MAKSQYRDIDIIKTWCLLSILNYTRYFYQVRYKREFVMGEHHKKVGAALDDVLSGKIKKLIINIAPRYSKTELAVKNFISMGLALNPRAKFIHLSYSDDLVRDNASDIQNILLEPEYQKLFSAYPTSKNSRKWYTKEGGGLYAVSSAGQVTGFGAGLVDKEKEEREQEEKDLDEFLSCIDTEGFGGAIVIDDPIKPDDALSVVMRDKVNNKFDTTLRNRVNSRNTPIVIIMQRVHENDLCGFLEAQEPGEWTVLSLPCIQVNDKGEEEALWPFKHTLQELKKLKELNSYVFETQYMQDPKPLTGQMYEQGFKTYEKIPKVLITRKCYTDTADEGQDYLCSIVYDESISCNYILDVIYTQKPMEVTEPLVAEQLTKFKVSQVMVESNAGGRSFARAVERLCREMKNNSTKIKWFHQGENKNIRIFTQSAAVQNLCYMPVGWDKMWPLFYKSLTSYMKIGKNDHDDAEDALTGTVEQRSKGGMKITDLSGMLP